MKTFKIYLFLFGVVAVIVCASVEVLRNWIIAMTFNSICFIDNSLKITSVLNPLIAWPIIFAFFGICYGLVRAVNRYKLNRGIKIGGIAGSLMLLLITVSISKPLDNGKSQEFGEQKLWDKLKTSNSYSLSTKYLERFPQGKHNAEVRIKQEQALWDSAIIYKTTETWKLYLTKFTNSGRYYEAKKYHENLLWSETKNLNTTNSYNNYIYQYPNGRFSKKAKIALKKLNAQPEQVEQVPTEIVADTLPTGEEPVNVRYDKINYQDGRVYEGYMINGVPGGGKGKMIYPDRTYLEGTWQNGNREGVYVFHRADGTTETQEFSNGSRIR